MTKQTKIIWAIVLILIIGSITISHTNTTKQTSSEPIKIGMISMLSGSYSVVGENFRNGALLAVEQYNIAHPDTKVELIVEDDGFDTKKAVSAYQKLTSINHINSLISVSTPSIGAIYDLVTKTDLPVIQGGEQTNEPTNDNVFQILPGNLASEKQLGEYLKQKGYKNPAVVYTQHDTMIRFKNALLEGYGSPVKEFAISADEKDFRTHVLKVSEIHPDVVVVLMFPESGAQFLKQYATSKGKLPQIAFDANAQSGLQDYIRILQNNSILENAIIAIISTDTTDTFKSDYKTRFGVEAGVWSDLGYDAAGLLISTHAPEGKTWIKNVHDAEFTGASGQIVFDDVGVRKPEMKISSIKSGKIQ
jgi:branched-chain amino acid transport system substrate-binding protein